MARASAARRAALQLLGEVRRRDARARDLLRSSSRVGMLDERDRALATRLVLGVTATIGLLDSTIESRLTGRSHLQPKVRDALRLSAYELMFLSTPSAAVVSQGVELVRLASPRAAGLANAVLRKIVAIDVPARESSLGRAQIGEASVDDLALVSGYPVWLLSEVQQERGAKAAHDIALSALAPAPIYVACNEARHDAQDTFVLLESFGLDPQTTELDGSFVLGNPAGLSASGLVEAVDVVVSDLSAQRVAKMAVPPCGGCLLEVGQGRGTKSILMQGTAHREHVEFNVTGIDAENFKTHIARDRMRRAGVDEWVSCMTFDACDLAGDVPKELEGPFDAVFVDAPCSGSGTLRRHPEIAWSLSKDAVDSLSELQLRMLRASALRVRSGGMLCYATCSVLSQENEEVVRRFLASDEGASFTLAGAPYQSLPAHGEPDGHFCSMMQHVKRG